MFSQLKTAAKAAAAGDFKGAQANLNDIGGHKSHEVPASGPPHASAAGQPGPPPQSYTAAAPPKQPATSSLDKVKEGLSKLDMHSAINAAHDIKRHNVSGLAHDAAHMKRAWPETHTQLACVADPSAPPVPDEVRLANEQKTSNMQGAVRFFKDLKHGHVLNATEDALNLSETNKRYQQQADELTRRRQVEARQMPGYADGGVIATAQAVKAQAIAVQEATEPVTGHSAQ